MCEGTRFDERACLAVNPFEGEDGYGFTLLGDRIRTARKTGPCATCGGQIHAGERVRARVETANRDIYSWRWCSACCHAMAISREDGGQEWTARTSLGMASSRVAQGPGFLAPRGGA